MIGRYSALTRVAIVAWAVVASAGASTAQSPAQRKCDADRIGAWRTFVACVQNVLVKDEGGAFYTPGFWDGTMAMHVSLSKCRHRYLSKWPKLQGTAYAGSTCARGVENRFADNGDGTVTDHLTGLVWEQKVDLDLVPNGGNVHDADNRFTFTQETTVPFRESGTVFTTFVPTLMLEGIFLGRAVGWRVPTLAELQSTVLDFPCSASSCTCPSTPCVDPALGAGSTHTAAYLTVTSDLHKDGDENAASVWGVATGDLPLVGSGFSFPAGSAVPLLKSFSGPLGGTSFSVRGVRGGF